MEKQVLKPENIPNILFSVGLNKERSKFVAINDKFFLAFQTSTFFSVPFGTRIGIRCFFFDVYFEDDEQLYFSFIPLLKIIEEDEKEDEYLEDGSDSSSDEEGEDELEDDLDNMSLRDKTMFSYQP